MPHVTAQTIAERIEALYGQPLAELTARAQANPDGSMLAALLATHADMEWAEQHIEFQLQRLRQLAAPEQVIGPFEASHLLDCARRVAESVAVRDAHTKSMTAVLQSLHRVPAPQAPSPAPPPPAAPAPGAAASTTPTR
ncbi:hypothetical protein [Streptomyces sp. NPDC056244]|uniref:hypothetical protein n=1 Tax=Streptomyces sp. NPDC056244 TaxID=3345762 RepID=UPI0035E08B9A